MTSRQPSKKNKHQKQPASTFTPQKKKTLRSAISARCSALGRLLLNLLVPLGGPKITEFTRDGQQCWEVYDPHTDTKIFFDSEHDVRIWLDQQKYRQ